MAARSLIWKVGHLELDGRSDVPIYGWSSGWWHGELNTHNLHYWIVRHF